MASLALHFVVPFFAVYSVYHLTAYPTVAGGDSGELMAEACQGGVPHPPGYPVYTMLSRWAASYHVPRLFYDSALAKFQFAATETTGWRINHMCCIFGALAGAFISLSISAILGPHRPHRWAGAWAGAALFAFSPSVWEYSIGGEVFSLNNAICAVIVYLGIKLTEISVHRDSSGDYGATVLLLLGAFFSGLGLANQHSSLLLLIFMIPALWLRFKNKITFLMLIILVFSGLLGLGPYAYLFFAAVVPKIGSWGNTASTAGLLRHILRSEYGTFQLGFIQGSEGSLERIYLYLKHLSSDNFHIPLPFAVFSVYHSLSWSAQKRSPNHEPTEGGQNSLNDKRGSKQKRHAVASSGVKKSSDRTQYIPSEVQTQDIVFSRCVQLLLLCWTGYTIVWHTVFSNLPLHAPMPFAVHSRFWMQPNILVAILAGTGIPLMWHYLSRWSRTNGLIGASMVQGFAVMCVAFLISDRWKLMDRSTDGWIMHSYGLHIVQTVTDYVDNEMPILLSHTDLDWNSVRYFLKCDYHEEEARISHLNFQLMPYPWFNETQTVNYPGINFPPILRSVSTARSDANNALLVSRFIQANLREGNILAANFGKIKPIFLDMQAIDERAIQSAGFWNEFLLVSWGLVYRVLPKVSFHVSGNFHRDSLDQLEKLQQNSEIGNILHWNNRMMLGYSGNKADYIYNSIYNFSATHLSRGRVNLDGQLTFGFDNKKYPPGSWEWAAVSVFFDAHYQYGLVLLSYGMEVASNVDNVVYGLIVSADRLVAASDILSNTLISVQALGGCLSSAQRDLEKNVATANMRLYGVIEKSVTFQSKFIQELNSWNESATPKEQRVPLLHDSAFLAGTVFTRIYQVQVAERTNEFISKFLLRYPDDKDKTTFLSVKASINQFVSSLSGTRNS